jgi:hypothetical protein
MAITLDGTAGITTPEIISTAGPVVVNGSAPDNSLVVAANGNVGIGSSSPSSKLEVNTGSLAAYFTRTAGDTGVLDPAFGIATTASTTRLGSSGDLQFMVGAVGTAAISQTEKMRIASDGKLFVGGTTSIGADAQVTIDAGTTNATTYNTLAARGGSRMYIQQQQTTSVSTTATVICTPGLYAGLCLIHGSDGTNRFQDLVMMSIGSGNVSVINSFSVSGTPASRTYSQSSSTYRIAMASGTYTVQFTAITMSS